MVELGGCGVVSSDDGHAVPDFLRSGPVSIWSITDVKELMGLDPQIRKHGVEDSGGWLEVTKSFTGIDGSKVVLDPQSVELSSGQVVAEDHLLDPTVPQGCEQVRELRKPGLNFHRADSLCFKIATF